MFNIIVSALLPIYVGLLIGYVAGKRGMVDNKNVKTINVMLMTFMVPLTMFIAISRTPREVIMPNLALIIVIGISMLILYMGSLWMQRKYFGLNLSEGVVQSLTIAFPNYASIGIPLMLPLYGDQAALLVAIAIAAGSIFVTPIALAQLRMGTSSPGTQVSVGHEFLKGLAGAVKTPVFFLPVLGLIWAILGIPMPAIVGTAFGPITMATGGVGLFLTGLLLSAQSIKIDSNVTWSTVLGNVVQPFLTFGIALAMGIDHETTVRAVILMAIPSAFFGLVFGATVNVRPAVSGATLLVSSVAGILTLSFFIGWLVP
ncbi:AEC family transporter [Neisseria montereyensis]|uniref:AEC family transporter n=1 Tax=Neisseria montereyensis TaxID=2973938 RepID=A0ABT2FDE5_9NEIS|nr:AEC family transporter [Neisseria montereyensis]MCS4534191.1 AEC family transporter [Neisseria montereyensis]